MTGKESFWSRIRRKKETSTPTLSKYDAIKEGPKPQRDDYKSSQIGIKAHLEQLKSLEPTRKHRVVELGEEFPFYDETTFSPERKRYESRVVLQGDVFPQIPITIAVDEVVHWTNFETGDRVIESIDPQTYFEAFNQFHFKGNVMTPFNLDLGYALSREDFDPEARANKVKEIELDPKYSERIRSEAGAHIFAYFTWKQFHKGTTIEEQIDAGRRWFNSIDYNYFTRLRLQLFFPDSAFEGRLSNNGNYPIDQYTPLDLFYPIETGMLSTVDTGRPQFRNLDSFRLLVPSDPEKLKQIKARFVLAREGLLVDYRKLVER